MPNLLSACTVGSKAETEGTRSSSQVGHYMYNAAGYAWTRVSENDAEKMAVASLRARGKALGVHDADTLSSQAMLALAWKNARQWEKVERLEVQVLETTKKVLGEEHPSTLTLMNNLASTYCNQGQWYEAETPQVQVMEEDTRAEHPSTLKSMGGAFRTQIFYNLLLARFDVRHAI